MEDLVVEIGIKLKNNLKFYEKILKQAGAVNTFNCETIDYYYTDKDINGLTENKMKNACVRYRMSRGLSGEDFNGDKEWKCYFQNYQIFDSSHSDKFKVEYFELKEYEDNFNKSGFLKIFDTSKIDY